MKKKSFLIDNGNLSKINNTKIVKINIKMYVSKLKNVTHEKWGQNKNI